LNQKTQILKSASVISLVTVFSRILGYVRDQRITLLLGTTPTADAFVLAYRIPSLIRRLVGEGAVTARSAGSPSNDACVAFCGRCVAASGFVKHFGCRQ